MVVVLVAVEMMRTTALGRYVAVVAFKACLPSEAAIPVLGIDPREILAHFVYVWRLFVFNILIDFFCHDNFKHT